jgi:putative ABC transport system permease protein
MMLRLAWRNIWRNKRRSLIILTSIVVGLAAVIFMEALSRGFIKQMLTNSIGTHIGHVQVHKKGFNDNKVVHNFMQETKLPQRALKADQRISAFSRRTIAFGLLSSASNSSGVLIVGIHAEEEERVTTIKLHLVEGRYLSGEKHEVVISKRLAETLGIGLGDRVVAMASTLDSKVGSDMFRVVGLFQSPNSVFDKTHIYVPLENAQEMLRVGEEIAEFTMIATHIDSVLALKEALAWQLGVDYEVLSYHDIIPTLLLQLEVAESSMLIFYLIIGAAMIFGISNTMLMSVFERINEFGVLKAVGMKDTRVFVMVMIEALLLGLVGTIAGTIVGIAINLPLQATGLNFATFSEGLASWGVGGIIYPVLDYSSLASGMILILGICLLAAFYPAYKAVRLEPISAMRYV